MGTIVNTHYAKTHLSGLLASVEAGEEVVIARNGKPIAKLIPASKPNGRREPGGWPIHIPNSFSEPLSAEEMDEIETGHPGDPLRIWIEKQSLNKPPRP